MAPVGPPKQEMPPTPHYRLLQTGETGRPVLRFAREVIDDEATAAAAGQPQVEVQPCLRRWLQSAGGPCTAAACQLELDQTIAAGSDFALRTQVRKWRRRATTAFAAMINELQARHVLTAAARRAIRPAIDLTVVDHRTTSHRPLPSAAWLLGY